MKLKNTTNFLMRLVLTFSFLGISNLTFSQEESGALPSRNQIDDKYKWNLEDVYPTEEAWQEDFDWIKANISDYQNYEGTLGSSSEKLMEFLKFDEKVNTKMARVFLYSMLSKDLDLGDAKYLGKYDETFSLYSDLAAKRSFVDPEILKIPKDKLDGFVNSNEELKVYKKALDDVYRMKEHTLTKEQEELMAMAAPITQIPYNAFSLFANADVQFPYVKDEDGNDIQISSGRYYAALYSNDRDYRRSVYKGYYKPFIDFKNTLVSLFNGNIKGNIFNSKARNYESARAAALDANNIPISVYDNLTRVASENLEPLHRWAAMKKRVLEIDTLHPYDTYVTLFPSVTKEYTYDESVEMTLEALKPLGEDYLKSLRMAFDNRWIDVYETKGKRSGAYSSGTTFGVHPYVLLNWNEQLNDVYTLAHEMGHNMHSYYTGENQPFPYADYSIFVAEVASTMNEAILLDYMIENAQSKEEKLALIEKNLNNITTTFYRQTRFAEYEKMVHEKTEAGESLTPDKLSEMYGELYQNYWGPEMKVDEEEKYTWARIPHFYYNFYVYQYATSFAASQALAAKIKAEGKPAIDKYLEFLKSGSSKYPVALLTETGVDLTSADPIIAVVNKMNDLLDKMEELLDEE